MLPPLADYASSRRTVLAAAAALGAVHEAVVHPSSGPDGEELATDVLRFGPPPGEARTVVMIGAGLHGVEGHAGSGLLQLLLGDGRLQGLPAGIAVVLLHAINPYGMAWSRRVDAENVDVNRNFVDFDAPRPVNEHYDRISPMLNPDDDELDLDDRSWIDRLWAFAGEVGTGPAFKAISGGQYEVAAGVQFGGQAPTWSRRTLEAIWLTHLRGAEAMLNVDIHTGLGPCAGLTIFQTADEDDAAAEVARAAFPSVFRVDRPTPDRPPLQGGVLGPGLDAGVPQPMLTVPIVAEFGTHADEVVLAAMRADNWLHHHGDPRSEIGARIRSGMRDAFFVDDESWRGTVADDGMRTIHAALDAAAEHPAA